MPEKPALKRYMAIPDPEVDNEGNIVAKNRDYIPTKGIWTKQLSSVLHAPEAGGKSA